MLVSSAVRLLRSLAVWGVVCAATVFFGVPAIPLALVPPRGELFLTLARGWARVILAASGVRVRVLHPERLQPGRSFVVAPNHETVIGGPCRRIVSTATDSRFFDVHFGIPSVCYGPTGGQVHAPDEWVDLESMRTCTKVLAGALVDWCGTT